jgi:ADP-ribose pyrophosphatase
VTLPALPKVELEIVSEQRVGDGGFLTIRRLELVARRGEVRSTPFTYDTLDRRAMDACVMVAHHVDAEGRVCVWLRSAVRPPLATRPLEPKHSGLMWETPAGLVEPGESPVAAAARELAEELGFDVDEGELSALGAPSAPAPGFIGELHHYFHVRVDPTKRREPAGDGSPLESDARVESVRLDDALEACRRGLVQDAKTELALRRLADEGLG